MRPIDFYVYIYWRLDINEPFYIGKGHRNRWKILCDRNKHFTNIINKYTVVAEIIKDGLSEEEAFYWEEEIIRILVFEYGYSIDIPNNRSKEKGFHLTNQTWGGEGTSGMKPFENKTEEEFEEIKRKISKANSGKNNGNYGKTGEKHPMYGKHHSEETRKKMSNEKKGKYIGEFSYSSKKVICLNTLKIFNCIKDVNRDEEYKKYKICTGRISTICKNGEVGEYRVISSGTLPDGTKLTWMYLEDYEKATKEEIEEKIKKANGMLKNEDGWGVKKCVICLNTLDVYWTIENASISTNVDRASISKCCSHNRKSAGKSKNGKKLVWMFLDEFLEKCIFIIL